MRPLLADFSAVEHEDTVGHPHRRKPVRDQDRHAAAGKIGEALEHLIFRARIERRRGFVQNQELGIAHVRASQSELLPLAAGEIGTAFKTPAEHLIVAARQTPDDCIGEALIRGLVDTRLVIERLDLPERDIVVGAHVVAHVVLENDADFAAQILDAVLAQVDAVEQN